MYLTGAQYEIQNRVDRKRTSTYYTSPDGVNVVRELLKDVPNKERIVVMDLLHGLRGSAVSCRRPGDRKGPHEINNTQGQHLSLIRFIHKVEKPRSE